MCLDVGAKDMAGDRVISAINNTKETLSDKPDFSKELQVFLSSNVSSLTMQTLQSYHITFGLSSTCMKLTAPFLRSVTFLFINFIIDLNS